MSNRIGRLHQLQGDQARAADPRAHAALSASAGTGKTQVLTGRVLRLLLSGAAPETILCLTFTKAAAAEMANRIGARLAAWVRMKEADLKKDLFALGENNDPLTVQRARRLFARVLEAPGGLRIQTIHAFAQTLLASFPAEAGVTPGFQALEGRAEQELGRTTLANLLANAEAARDEDLLRDVQSLSLRLGEAAAVEYLMRCARSQEALAALGPSDGIEAKVRVLMGLPDESIEEYVVHNCGDDRFDCHLLRAVADANRRWGAQTGLGHADLIENWLALSPIERAAALPSLRKVVLTDKDTLRVSPGQARAEPHYESHAGRLANLIGELLTIQNGARLASDMAAGLRAGRAFADAYAQAKRAAGVADFDDLIRWTQRLLAQPSMGEWVRYKLDQRTDHILVDEAQDTNAAQWDIVWQIAREYFSGSSETERRVRTVFTVGDFKQAIYGFQGTDPSEFERMRGELRRHSDALREESDEAPEFRDLSINASFRSAQPVLDVVDAVIQHVGFREMGLFRMPPAHLAHHSNRPGLVELWKPFTVEGEGEESEEGWLDEDVRLYADRLAEQVREWIDEAPILDSTKRPLTAGDILILVRSRGELASLIVARLFQRRVPVAGIDRLFLSKPFAVRDLLAAVTFAIQPLDDLNLANLLVSPLIGWDQQQLFGLAYGREKRSLWRMLRERSNERPDFAAARGALGDLLGMADFTTPSQFLEAILSGPLDGRRKLYRRLGLAARDPIDELMTAALEFERNEVPSLERFQAWFARGDVEIQRDPSERANAVRVMTVHGAKGLEAPYVILADATADPANLGRRNPPLDLPIGTDKVPVIRPRKAELSPPFDALVAEEKARDLEEHWRLLYVAMTRASERLVIGGIMPTRDVSENSWHKRVRAALSSLGAMPEEDGRWGTIWRYRGSVPERKLEPRAARAQNGPPPPLPHWVRASAPAEPRPPRPLAPSQVAEDREPSPPPSPALRAAAQRGTIIHHLLERLVEVPPEDRRERAIAWLERSAGVAVATDRQKIADQVCSVLADPSFSELFGPGSLGEAPLAATLPDGRVIAGTVDRLLIEEGRVSVLDFKTGRVPSAASAIPAAHLAQMKAYTEALQVIFPAREIRAALLYTAGPQLFDLAS